MVILRFTFCERENIYLFIFLREKTFINLRVETIIECKSAYSSLESVDLTLPFMVA